MGSSLQFKFRRALRGSRVKGTNNARFCTKKLEIYYYFSSIERVNLMYTFGDSSYFLLIQMYNKINKINSYALAQVQLDEVISTAQRKYHHRL